MTNKQQSQEIQPEGISASVLLGGWYRTLGGIEECRRINKESGVKNPDDFIRFDDEVPMTIKKYKAFLEATINERNNSPHTLESLIAAGTINESERVFYPNNIWPRRELLAISRVQDVQKAEWLTSDEMWYGLDSSGVIKNTSVNSLHYYKQIVPTFSLVEIDPTRAGSRKVRIAKVHSAVPWWESGKKTYTTPFNLENVNAIIQNTQPPTTDPTIANTKYYLVRENITNITSAPNLETFVNANFDILWEQRTAPNPVINVDGRSLLSHLKAEGGQNQYA